MVLLRFFFFFGKGLFDVFCVDLEWFNDDVIRDSGFDDVFFFKVYFNFLFDFYCCGFFFFFVVIDKESIKY